ncbi:MAG: tRNA (adenosine(37)-N6)-threonylcarbamoyltransferase complex ATPase subunit type 1 TsaE [Alphaproteobacteria bacterium]|nr:MAG: tRNA (adenosine(37)-N6)-threonylcarbamoyltransferase complex ATPase subunit type 1 TsaE [Alphaproteobacteria bacterium]
MAATVLLETDCPTEAATASLAAALAARLRAGDMLALTGDLGAGKSTFARAFIRARLGDADAEVPSPTFTLVQSYEDGDGVEIWHADLYRLSEPEEAYELGLDDAREAGICLIEWPDRMPADWWQGALEITFTIGGKGERHVRFSSDDAAWAGRLQGLVA